MQQELTKWNSQGPYVVPPLLWCVTFRGCLRMFTWVLECPYKGSGIKRLIFLTQTLNKPLRLFLLPDILATRGRSASEEQCSYNSVLPTSEYTFIASYMHTYIWQGQHYSSHSAQRVCTIISSMFSACITVFFHLRDCASCLLSDTFVENMSERLCSNLDVTLSCFFVKH